MVYFSDVTTEEKVGVAAGMLAGVGTGVYLSHKVIGDEAKEHEKTKKLLQEKIDFIDQYRAIDLSKQDYYFTVEKSTKEGHIHLTLTRVKKGAEGPGHLTGHTHTIKEVKAPTAYEFLKTDKTNVAREHPLFNAIKQVWSKELDHLNEIAKESAAKIEKVVPPKSFLELKNGKALILGGTALNMVLLGGVGYALGNVVKTLSAKNADKPVIGAHTQKLQQENASTIENVTQR